MGTYIFKEKIVSFPTFSVWDSCMWSNRPDGVPAPSPLAWATVLLLALVPLATHELLPSVSPHMDHECSPLFVHSHCSPYMCIINIVVLPTTQPSLHTIMTCVVGCCRFFCEVPSVGDVTSGYHLVGPSLLPLGGSMAHTRGTWNRRGDYWWSLSTTFELSTLVGINDI